MTKKTFVLVHSAWLGAWQWKDLKNLLEAAGHKVFTPDLPGHGDNQAFYENITMEDYTREVIKLLDKQVTPVVLLGHSFNGITVSRVAELRPKKIACLVYLTAFLLPRGASFFSAVENVEGSTAVDNFYLSDDKKFALVNAERMHEAFAHDLPVDVFEKAKEFIVPEPAGPLEYELETTSENWGNIPKYYIECTQDRAIPVAIQRAMHHGVVKKSFSLESSHTPNFSQPQALAEILLNLD